MLSKLRKLLKGSTAADFEAALTAVDIPALEAALDAANQKRSSLLLTGADAAVLAAEKEIDTARIDLDRGHAARAELARKLAEAKARELDESFNRDYREAEEIAARQFQAVVEKVLPAVAVIEESLRALELSDGKISRINHVTLSHMWENNAPGRSGSAPLSVWQRINAKPDLLPSWAKDLFLVYSSIR